MKLTLANTYHNIKQRYMLELVFGVDGIFFRVMPDFGSTVSNEQAEELRLFLNNHQNFQSSLNFLHGLNEYINSSKMDMISSQKSIVHVCCQKPSKSQESLEDDLKHLLFDSPLQRERDSFYYSFVMLELGVIFTIQSRYSAMFCLALTAALKNIFHRECLNNEEFNALVHPPSD